jgi:hypothetical protein
MKPQTDYLDDLLLRQPLLVGDLILGGLLQGFQKDADLLMG